MLRAPPASEVGRGRSHGEALLARADGHGDHVLLQPLFVADTRIATRRQNVHKAVLYNHLQANAGMGCKEGRHDARQHQTRGAHWDVEPKRAGGLTIKADCPINCGLDLTIAGPSRSKRRAPASATVRLVRLKQRRRQGRSQFISYKGLTHSPSTCEQECSWLVQTPRPPLSQPVLRSRQQVPIQERPS